jgi:hypothetical protein
MFRSKDWPFWVFLTAIAILGILLTRHYGESWDELKFYKYADLSLHAYSIWPTTGAVPEFGNTYDNYGPAYVMLVSLGASALQIFIPWSLSDLRHLLYFLTFLVGVWAFYALARRWLSQIAAFGAALLFMAQPLFWGHAFISPKDIPFLTFFLLSLLFGLRLFDNPQPLSLNGFSPRSRRILLVLTALWLASVFVLFLGVDLVHAWIDSAVRAAAAGQPNLIARIASDLDKVEPDVYTQRYFTLFIQARLIYFLLSTLFLVYLYHHLAPTTLQSLTSILLPAIFLGLATSIRLLGPLAGLLITIYALRGNGKNAILTLAVYASFALAAMYVSWPYLWPDPLGRFVESLRVMSQYPWPGQVLFDGTQYASTDIPRSYLPVLLGIQLTEPVWVLFIAGLTVAIAGFVNRREYVDLLALTLVWFVLPLTGFIVSRSPLYDNFRQIFFILPPVFLMAGVVFEKIKRPAMQMALIVLIVLPGIIGIIRLHPYEYIYYNTFVSGELGAFRRFELDYWGTSYREAADWLNKSAPPDANVWVDGPAHLLDMYLREDLDLYSTYEAERAEQYDYAVSTTRYGLDLTSFPDAKIAYKIERSNALLAVIKQP